MLAGAALAEIGQRLFGEAIEIAGVGVTLDLGVQTRAIERFKPVAESSELVRRQSDDSVSSSSTVIDSE